MKNKISSWFSFLVLVSCNLLAQDKQTDSLIALLKITTTDTSRVNTMIAISKSYLNSDPVKAIQYANKAKELSEKINFRKGYAYSMKNIGNAKYLQGKYAEAISSWQQALIVFDSSGDRAGAANMLSNQGAVYFNQGNDAKSLELHLKSLKIAEEINDTIRIVTSLINTGAIYLNKPTTYDKARENFLRALPISIASGDKYSIALVTANLGDLFAKMGDDSTALVYLNQSLKYSANTIDAAYPLNESGKIYARQKKYDLAIKTHLQALGIAKKMDARLDMMQSLIGLAKAYYQNREIKFSISSYNQALDIGFALNATNEIKDIYEGLALDYAQQSDFTNAYKYQTLLLGIKDTIYNLNTDKKLAALQFTFDLQKKESQINLLKKDNIIQHQEINKQKIVRNSFIAGFILVLAIVGVTLNRYRLKQKSNKQLSRTLNELKNTQEQLIKSEKMAALGAMASRISHEIQNPLNFVNNFSDMSQDLVKDVITSVSENEKKENAELLIENLRKINEHGKRAAMIVKQLQEHSSKGTAQEFFETKHDTTK